MKPVQRRRLIAAASVAGLLLAIVIALALGSGGSGPRFSPAGGPAASVISPQTPAPRRTPRPTAFRPAPAASSLAAHLSLARQVAQLFMVTLQGKSASAVSELAAVDWSGIVFDSSNFSGDSQASALASRLTAAARRVHHVAPLIAATQEGGPDTALPDLPPKSEPAIGASARPMLAGEQALAAGRRLRKIGFNMTLAPLADVDTPTGALSGRLFSTDPAIVARLSSAAVDGYSKARVISAVGHFPGAGAASADPDQMAANVGGSLPELRGRDLIPFTALAATAPVILMSNASYVAFDGVTPAGLLRAAVQLLRNGYGFQGVVMSDDLDAALQSTGADPGSTALQALQAGDDLLYISGAPSERQQAYERVLSAARSSTQVRSLVREALLRVLTLKLRYGILR